MARTGPGSLLFILWSQESAAFGKNFRKNSEKIEKMVNFFNLFNMLAKLEGIWISPL